MTQKRSELILVVEDDAKINHFICYALKQDGFNVLASDNAQDALSLLVFQPVDLMLLDLGLPDFDGMDVIRKVREWSELPIIVVSARDQDREKVAALDAGADDYLPKPFSAAELMARIRVALRHLYKENPSKWQASVEVGELRIDFDKRLVYLADSEVHLTPMEYSLLAMLFRNIGKVLTTGALIRELYGPSYGTDTQALRTLMAGLRRKVEANPSKSRYILTEIGIGYRLVDE